MSNLPDLAQAKLPSTYANAKRALSECVSLDECQEWSDKAAALASYAKMAEDDELERLSKRIRGRAIRRAGELLKQIEPAKGGDRRSSEYQSDAADTLISRKEVAQQAGMSVRQQLNAIRVANVPKQEFEKKIEAANPATITQLAKMGTKPRLYPDTQGRPVKEHRDANMFLLTVKDYRDEMLNTPVPYLAKILTEGEREKLRVMISEIDAVHDQLATKV